MDALLILHPDLASLAEAVEALSTTATLADNSVAAYGLQWRTFCRWAEKFGLQSLPADVPTTLLYIGHLVVSRKGKSTLGQALAAIAYQHERAGWESPTRHSRVVLLSIAAKKKIGRVSAPVMRAHPLSVPELLRMVEVLPVLPIRSKLAELNRIRMQSVLLTAWHTARRLEELVRADIAWTTPRADGTLGFLTPSQKCHPDGFGNVLYPTTDLRLCPVDAHERWIEASAPFRDGVSRLYGPPAVDASGEIFISDRLANHTAHLLAEGRPAGDERYATDADYEAYCRSAGVSAAFGELAYLLKKWMEFAQIAPLSPDRRLGSHSNRRGLVTALRSAGVDLRVIANHVGWVQLGTAEMYSDFIPGGSPLSALQM